MTKKMKNLIAKSRYIRAMHFSRQISQLHSTFSLLAALKLRQGAN